MDIQFSKEKNRILKQQRNISFEDIIVAIENNKVLDIINHTNLEKYPNQKMMIVNISNYIYVVPFVRDEIKIFLKTIVPSRKMTKRYLKGEENGV
ncbi:hypothetical protein ThvES_00017010 [Thiovulum sp. ES]|nr:hypothetical protein ThvES_00017010 [Thiovulum sp. ES]